MVHKNIKKTIIIAEAGVNHNGNINTAKKLIIAAKKAGAELILVPVANFEEAQPFETDKTAIVAVDSFDEALSVISQYSSR